MSDVDKFAANKHPIQPMNETALRFVADMERSGVKIVRRAELALMASPAGKGLEGRLTPCPVAERGLEGIVGGSGAIGEDRRHG